MATLATCSHPGAHLASNGRGRYLTCQVSCAIGGALPYLPGELIHWPLTTTCFKGSTTQLEFLLFQRFFFPLALTPWGPLERRIDRELYSEIGADTRLCTAGTHIDRVGEVGAGEYGESGGALDTSTVWHQDTHWRHESA